MAAVVVDVDDVEFVSCTTPVCSVVAERTVFFVAVMSPFSFCEMVSMKAIAVLLADGLDLAACLCLQYFCSISAGLPSSRSRRSRARRCVPRCR